MLRPIGNSPGAPDGQSATALGLVEEANSGREETVFVARGVGPDGPQPSAGGE